MKKRIVLLLSVVALMVVMLAISVAPASAATFSNTDGITINDAVDICSDAAPQQHQEDVGEATPYPSGIAVSELGSSVSDVNVTLTGFSHAFPDDVAVLLVGPEGQTTILMADVGGRFFNSDPNSDPVNLTFDDAAAGGLPDNPDVPLSSGTYQPTRGTAVGGPISDCIPPESFPADAPAGPYGSALSVFNGTNPNGTWNLYVIDDTDLDTGSITGWSLDISATTAADTTPPTVTDTSPDGTASRTATVTATFDEEVQNVTSSTFILERQIAVKKTDPPKYVLVAATVSLSPDGSYVLDPVEDLPKGEYRATIKTAVTDMADNALTEDVVWNFTVKK